MIFMKPSHSAFLLDGRTLSLPGQFGSVHYEVELVFRMGRRYEKGIAISDLILDFAVGLDLTLRDLQSELKKQMYPWLKAKGFLHSAPLAVFRPMPPDENLLNTDFSLNINGVEKQRGRLHDAIFGLPTLISHIGEHYGLDEGDLIFTGTPEGVGQIRDKDQIEMLWDDQRVGYCDVSIRNEYK